MSTFIAVNDGDLAGRVGQSRVRIVYVAPGISTKVARAIGERFQDFETLDVTVVLDPDEEVCRLGYGDVEGLAILHTLAVRHHLTLRKQAGLRIGVLLVDDDLLVWSPTAQSVEAAPLTADTPNGLVLGRNFAETLVAAIAPEGTEFDPYKAEIGRSVVTPDNVKATEEAIRANPVVPVALSQVTRVFSSKLQFVELEIRNARLSKTTLTIPKDMLNADVVGELRELLETKLKAFGELRHHAVEVQAFTSDGEAAFGSNGQPLTMRVSEADLDQLRTRIERRFLHHVGDRETLIARNEKQRFEVCVEALQKQLFSHAASIRMELQRQTEKIVDEAIRLIVQRLGRGGTRVQKQDVDEIRRSLTETVSRRLESEPSVAIRYKDVTFEHTQNKGFRERVRKSLPAGLQKQLGAWDEHFRAVKEGDA